MKVAKKQGVFRPAWWATNAHVQTISPVFLPFEVPQYTRERWDTPDGDFVDMDWVNLNLAHRPKQKILVLFHGLEGSSSSSYAKALMHMALTKGWTGVVMHWRSCSGEINRQKVMYHSGFSWEIDWVVKRIAGRFPESERYLAGVSLGGSAMLKWLGENGIQAEKYVTACASICAPHDLKAGAAALKSGFNQRVYMRNFLGTIQKKALLKIEQFPELPITSESIHTARNFYELDNAFTAPLHGFRDAQDYWSKASSKQFMPGIAVPTMVLNTANDPFVPASSLAKKSEISAKVHLRYTENGGHVGFVTARQIGDEMRHFSWMPAQVFKHFESLS